MKKMLSTGMIVFAGIVCLPASVTQVRPQLSTAGFRYDPRLLSLQNFFARHKAPVKSLSPVFLEAADHYDLDWRLLPSLSFVESTGGKAARKNNLFGWDQGRAEFPSMRAAIQTVAYNLAHSKCYRDKNLDQMLETYNPNPDYPQKVKSVMRRIAPSAFLAE